MPELEVVSEKNIPTVENGIKLSDFKGSPESDADELKEDTRTSTDNEDDTPGNACSRCVERVEVGISRAVRRNQRCLQYGARVLLLLAYASYVSYCLYYRFGDVGSYILIIVTVILGLVLTSKSGLFHRLHCRLPDTGRDYTNSVKLARLQTATRYILYVLSLAAITVYLTVDILRSHSSNAQSLLGVAAVLCVCYITSVKPSKVNWHPVYWGFVIQFVFATLTLRTQVGYDIFKWIGDFVQTVLSFANAGAEFVLTKDFRHFGLAFTASSGLIFFNCIICALMHLGVIESVVLKMGYMLSWCLETGPLESVIAAANIFIGMSEAPLLIRPYLPHVTRSELHAILVCGFASISGGVLSLFINLGIPANHLLTAAIISAPAALALAKLSYPETSRVDLSKQRDISMGSSDPGASLMSVVSAGAIQAVGILVGITANMAVFVSFMAALDGLLDWLGERAGYSGLSFDLIASYVLWPLAYVMGTHPTDCGRVGALIGTKLAATPMVAYSQLGDMIENRRSLEQYLVDTNGTGSWHWDRFDVVLDGLNTSTTLRYGVMSERSEVIATYAMCGFSAFTSIGISLGMMAQLCPARRSDVVAVVFRAFLVGNLASFTTGSIAGVMYTGDDTTAASGVPAYSI